MLAKIAIATAFAAVIAHDIKTQIESHKAAEIFMLAHEAHEKNEAISKHQIEYLLSLIKENGGELSEFDLLALNFKSH